ncbi:TRAP transporter small permease subunit [Vibrio sp. CAIM 722]|uniref:TRAP transporter small permease protein n=1 Tax=Vibrio eleionomae TaxID=2653505 RepID=A0A7X4RWE9_9VIBR|nr:TRAP transporter small permease [Vibrio eleionomae]MZI95618.1 TRAP transporter small permease subunit [Vibrio eleionomae]
MDRLVHYLKRINQGVAVVAGLALLAGVLLICAEIVLRACKVPFTGSDEISGYLMAAISSWGLSYGLLTKAHVRIDILRNQAPKALRAVFDLLAIMSLSYVAIFVATKVETVVAKTGLAHSLANTALATPLIIPQSIWFAGWVWLAISSSILSIYGIYLVCTKQFTKLDDVIGTESEV